MIGGALLLTSVLTWGREFAEELSAKVFGHFGYEYAAEPPDGFLRPFEACRLLPGHDRQSLEDHVRGEVGGVPFELAEAFLERKVRRDKRDDYDLVFRGLVARYRFPKRFSGRTYVLRRPPPHLRKNSNETMRREARMLAPTYGEHPHSQTCSLTA